MDLKLSNYSTTAAMNGSIALANNATLATVAANYGLKTVVDQHSLDIAARITPLEVDTKVANALLEAAQPARAGRRHRRAERPVAEGQAAQDLQAGDSGALQLPLRLTSSQRRIKCSTCASKSVFALKKRGRWERLSFLGQKLFASSTLINARCENIFCTSVAAVQPPIVRLTWVSLCTCRAALLPEGAYTGWPPGCSSSSQPLWTTPPCRPPPSKPFSIDHMLGRASSLADSRSSNS